MPKIKAADFLERKAYSESLIDQKIRANRTTPRRVAAGIKMPASTFYAKKKEPGTFTVDQVNDLARNLGWTDLELLSFIRGKKIEIR